MVTATAGPWWQKCGAGGCTVEHAGGTSGPGAVGMGALSHNMVMESGQEGSRVGGSALAEA